MKDALQRLGLGLWLAVSALALLVWCPIAWLLERLPNGGWTDLTPGYQRRVNPRERIEVLAWGGSPRHVAEQLIQSAATASPLPRRNQRGMQTWD